MAGQQTGLETAGRRAVEERGAVLRRYREHVNVGTARLGEFMAAPVEVRSAGSLVFDQEDQAYLNCGGYGVFLLGHCHPAVVAAVRDQLERHPLSTRVLLNPEQARAAESLAGVTPKGLDYTFFTNSGAEAVEAGIKLARLNGKHRLIAMNGGYHGKTMGALSVTGRLHYQAPFAPLVPQVEFVAYGDAEGLRESLSRCAGEAAVILEPVQAEGGVIIPPDGYLQDVRALCDEYGALLILDEIQTGMGRLGSWWGSDQEGVVPDIMLVGKILSGGTVPVGAMVAKPSVYAPLNRDPMLHSSTFAGNPLAMAAVQAAIRVIDQEDLVSRARTLGESVLTALRHMVAETCPNLVVQVRGRGLLIGVEFASEHLAGDFMMELLKRRVIVSHSLNSHRVVRFTPPAVMTPADCTWLFGAVGEAAAELWRRHG